MSRFLLISICLIAAAAFADAQERPLSPDTRSPVPLSVRGVDERLPVKKDGAMAVAPAARVSVPVARVSVPVASGRLRVSSGHPTIDRIVLEAAALNGLDPNLILAVMKAESGYNPNAVSHKGASGLMQLIPATAARFGVTNIFDPRENIHAGAKYLRWLLDRFEGDLRLALAGYNAGEAAVESYGLRIPPYEETQNYVRTIYTNYSRVVAGVEPETVQSADSDRSVDTARDAIPSHNQIVRVSGTGGLIVKQQ